MHGVYTLYNIILLHFYIGYTERSIQSVCVPIEGRCNSGVLPGFIINGQWTLWPTTGNTQYNVTYSHELSTFTFCFRNITDSENIIMLSEYCYQSHTVGCSLCSHESNEIIFKSYSHIFLQIRSKSLYYCPYMIFRVMCKHVAIIMTHYNNNIILMRRLYYC